MTNREKLEEILILLNKKSTYRGTQADSVLPDGAAHQFGGTIGKSVYFDGETFMNDYQIPDTTVIRLFDQQGLLGRVAFYREFSKKELPIFFDRFNGLNLRNSKEIRNLPGITVFSSGWKREASNPLPHHEATVMGKGQDHKTLTVFLGQGESADWVVEQLYQTLAKSLGVAELNQKLRKFNLFKSQTQERQL